MLIQQLINGLNLGSIYALIALGYTMVYGIAKMLNFAHGDVIMVGGFTMLVTLTALGASLGANPILLTGAAVLASVAVCTVLGVLIEKIAYKPLRNASPLTVLITAIGVSYFLQSLSLLIFGSNARRVNDFFHLGNIALGDVSISGNTVLTLAVTVLIMIGLTLFIRKTKTGRAMLAVSEDKGAAELMGVNVNRTISVTFAIGSALAAVASILYLASFNSYVDPYMGSLPGIKAFVAAVLGGIGSVPGAMIGGILLGLIETITKAYISTNIADAIVFSVLIIVLLVRPTGLLGKKRMEKV
ncbi:MAG TPA: branched-chain amino acid ABC transporter permease [Candidatus Avimonoglobus intestinipullorum]|uniref:Branched-chain amino acid ABC transporter permease n=1 Tax=Candidatus Avimonoglobus intestinipullorum TaxID=2840699 RepID=A0A9D1LVE7_9FIRM|nr:branched-chain amino acid ABC transporter permease [Candidatus Avimonoglobus intestinipullorum]